MPLDQLAGTDTEAQPDDLRAGIAALFDSDVAAGGESLDSGSSTQKPSPGADENLADEPHSASGEKSDASPATSKGDHPTDPNRYADGTFKRTKAEVAAEKAAPAEKSPSTDTVAKASDVAASNPQDAPPAGWTADAKAEWSKLSPALKAAVLKREVEIASGGRQWSEEKRRYETALSPVAQAASRRGISTEEGIQRLVAAQERLDRNPAEALRWMAQSYGVDLATLAGQQPAEGQRETSPNLEATVRQILQPLLAPIQDQLTSEANARQQSTLSAIERFAATPGREHYKALEPLIASILPHVIEDNPAWTHEQKLSEAYDRASRANPQTYAAVQAASAATAEAQRRKEAQDRANKARLAGSSVTGAPSGSQAIAPKDSLRAEIEAAMSPA